MHSSSDIVGAIASALATGRPQQPRKGPHGHDPLVGPAGHRPHFSLRALPSGLYIVNRPFNRGLLSSTCMAALSKAVALAPSKLEVSVSPDWFRRGVRPR